MGTEILDNLPPLLTYQEFADLWGMSLSTLRRRVVEGWVNVVRTGQICRITREEFVRLRRESEQRAGRPTDRSQQKG